MHPQSDDEQIIDAMSDALRHHGDGCTKDDLALRFTSAEIERCLERARARANDRAVYQRRARVQAKAA